MQVAIAVNVCCISKSKMKQNDVNFHHLRDRMATVNDNKKTLVTSKQVHVGMKYSKGNTAYTSAPFLCLSPTTYTDMHAHTHTHTHAHANTHTLSEST